MLSYRHAFHAGNHADILKHYVFSLILDYFNQKDKPYYVIDTHAGAGMYSLNSDHAKKNMEFQTGIARLIQTHELPDSLAKFCAMVRSFNSLDNLEYYPGSPKVADYFLRDKDRLQLFELHPSDYDILQNNFHSAKNIRMQMKDGFGGLKSCLPPLTKRAITIIDPPYEQKADYERVVEAIKDSLKRFSTGCYIVWYPLLQRDEPQQMIASLNQLNIKNWMHVTLKVTKPNENGMGMFGSGLFIINPPWTLPESLKESMPHLESLLGQDASAQSNLTFNIN